jgi:hypothetical protein
MLRSVMLLAALAAPGWAAIWPDQAGDFRKTASKALEPAEKKLLAEYGFEEAEQAEYSGGGRRFAAVAYRFKDSTGAYAGWLWLRAQSPNAVQVANYVLQPLTGGDPGPFAAALPKPDTRPLPGLPVTLPAQGLAGGSERYILGPESLARFAPQVPAGAAGFEFGPEGEVAQYRLPSGPATMAVFEYPNPQIAIKQFGHFERIPGAMVRRTGSLVAVVFSPPDRDQAERLLAGVRYNAEVTWTEPPADPKNDVAEVLINIFILTAILICLFVGAGVVVGLLRYLFTGGSAKEPMVMLHLDK